MSDRTRLVFVRHGRTAFNVEGRLQGRLDMPLDEVGRRQAFTVAQVIAAMEPDAIIASPLQRARDTAQAIGACAGLGVQLDDRLIEIDVGRWSGQRAADLRRNDPEYAAGVVSPIDYRRADGETASEVADRIVAVCQDVVAQYAGGTIILVAHGFALRTGICWLLGGDYGASRCLGGLDNCSWSIVDHLPEDVVEARGFLSPRRLMAHNCGVPVPVDVDFAKGA